MEEAAHSTSYERFPLQLHQPGPTSGEELQARSCSNGAIQIQVSSGNHLNQGSKYYAKRKKIGIHLKILDARKMTLKKIHTNTYKY